MKDSRALSKTEIIIYLIVGMLPIYWLTSDDLEEAGVLTPDASAIENKGIQFSVTPYSRGREVVDVLEDFFKYCEGFNIYRKDIVEASATMQEEGLSFGSKSRGWNREMAIEIKISKSPALIPGNFHMSGSTLRYELGAGKMPGAYTHKRSEQLFCGMTPNVKGENQLLSIPSLAKFKILTSEKTIKKPQMQNKHNKGKPVLSKDDAGALCMSAVRKNARYPSSVDFSIWDSLGTRAMIGGGWKSQWAFESMNGLGAMIPLKVYCEIKDGKLQQFIVSNR